ncbi:hypothetical protein N7488_007407 [Penicillium malachiteum]|nr:hypothetical protein N7488_007407 [Penicillium malachiteum]
MGPFKILEIVHGSYKLDLPAGMRIHPVFHAEKLRLAFKKGTEPMPGQWQEPPPPLEVNGDLEWEVQEIRSSRRNNGRCEYLVKWVGHDNDRAWYRASNFTHSIELLKEFHERFPAKVRPLRLPQWITLSEAVQDIEEHEDDCLAEPRAQTDSRANPASRGG